MISGDCNLNVTVQSLRQALFSAYWIDWYFYCKEGQRSLKTLSFSFKGYALALILDQILQFSFLEWVVARVFSSYHLQFCFRVLSKEKVGTIFF